MKSKKTLIDLIRKGTFEEIEEALKTASHDEVNEFGHTPLIVTIHTSNRKDFEKIFDLILKWDTCLDKKDNDGYSAFSHAISLRKMRCAEKLLEKNVDVNVPCVATVAPHPRAYKAYEQSSSVPYPRSTMQKMSALALLIYKSYDEMVEKILEKDNVDLDVVGGLDITALSMSARSNNLEITEYLLARNANPNVVPRNWRQYASKEEDVCPIALKKALKYGYGAIISMLIAAGSRVPKIFPRKDNMYSTPLTYLFSQPQQQLAEPFHCLRVLKEFVPITLCDSQNRSPLSYAVENNISHLVLEGLLDEEINNLSDIHGYTPMMYAWQNRDYQTMDFLYKRGGISIANNVFEPTGETLLMISLQEKDEDMIRFLLSYNPMLLHKNKKGQSVLDFKTGNTELDTKIELEYKRQTQNMLREKNIQKD